MTKVFIKLLFIVSLTAFALGCNESIRKSSKNPQQSLAKQSQNENSDRDLKRWPVIKSPFDKDPEIERKISSLIASMTLEQKVAQMIQPEIRSFTVADMKKYGFGSWLNGGGAYPNNNKHASVEDWVSIAEKMYQASMDSSDDGISIPTMWGTDAVHGHNNVIGATLFPHNIGLGATRDPQLIQDIAYATAQEVAATGIDWVFAPTVATVRNDRWGRTYEGYSEDPKIIKQYAKAFVEGMQGKSINDLAASDHVISTVKHFIGDGGTENGVDQGNNPSSEEALVRIHAQGYVGGLSAGAQTVMASFNRWQGQKVHGQRYLLTEVLKQRMGFDGLVVGDWNGHGQVKNCDNSSCPDAINAGIDIIMVPSDWQAMLNNTIAQVKTGAIAMSRIDDAVSRILRVKFRAGLFDKASPAKQEKAGVRSVIGNAKHRALARKAVRKSIVLLKNKNHLLPLSPKQNFLIVGDGANNIGKQSGGWSVTWQGTGNVNSDFPGATSIYQGFANQIEAAGGTVRSSIDGQFKVRPDVAIVVFGEEPYAEGEGDREDLNYSKSDAKSLALLRKLKQENIPVVSLFISGRPMWVNPELNASDAFVAIWLPGTEGEGIADVILKDKNEKLQFDFSGKLSYSWPKSPNQTSVNIGDKPYDPLLPYGFGLTYADDNILADDLNEFASTGSTPGSTTEDKITLFGRSVEKPFQMFLTSGNHKRQVTANVEQLAGISYQTIDKTVQEDAFRIKFSGKSQKSISIESTSSEALDLSKRLDANTWLQFDLVLNKKQIDNVLLSIGCLKDLNCNSQLSIQPNLEKIAIGNWHRIAIPLICFDTRKMNKSKIKIPFAISGKGSADISLTKIEITSTLDDGAVAFNCQ